MRRTVHTVIAATFGGGGLGFTQLAARWSREYDEIALFSAHTDGLTLSIGCAATAAVLLLGGAIAAMRAALKGARKPNPVIR